MTPNEAYGVLTAIGRLTDAMTQVEAQRDAALAEVQQLKARVAQIEEGAEAPPQPDGA